MPIPPFSSAPTPDASSSKKGKVQLANDLGGSAAAPSVVDLTITSQAQGDVLYYNGSNWVRLAAGTSGQFLKTLGAGANPSWGDAGGGSTPYLVFNLVNYATNNLSASSEGGLAGSVGGGGGSVVYGATTGMRVNSGSGAADSYAVIYSGANVPNTTGSWANSIYNRNFVFTAVAGMNLRTNTDLFIGTGGLTNSVYSGTGSKVVGFRGSNIAGVKTWYTITGTGTLETATDVTTAINAADNFQDTGTDKVHGFVIEFVAGTSAKFYCNGVLLATHTTNLPTGMTGSNGQTIGNATAKTIAAGASSTTIDVHSMFINVEAY